MRVMYACARTKSRFEPCTHARMLACLHVCMLACVHVYMCTCVTCIDVWHVSMWACVHVCMCVHVCAYCACVHVCTHLCVWRVSGCPCMKTHRNQHSCITCHTTGRTRTCILTVHIRTKSALTATRIATGIHATESLWRKSSHLNMHMRPWQGAGFVMRMI